MIRRSIRQRRLLLAGTGLLVARMKQSDARDTWRQSRYFEDGCADLILQLPPYLVMPVQPQDRWQANPFARQDQLS
jgi:hypothetical protein